VIMCVVYVYVCSFPFTNIAIDRRWPFQLHSVVAMSLALPKLVNCHDKLIYITPINI